MRIDMTIGSWVRRNGGRHRAGDRPRRHRSLRDCRGMWPAPAQPSRACGSVQVTGERLWAVAPRWNVRGFSVIRATEGTRPIWSKCGNENRPCRFVLSALRVPKAIFWRVGATPSDLTELCGRPLRTLRLPIPYLGSNGHADDVSAAFWPDFGRQFQWMESMAHLGVNFG